MNLVEGVESHLKNTSCESAVKYRSINLYAHKVSLRSYGLFLSILIVTIVVAILLFSMQAQAQESYNIPSWIKNNAKWWSQGQIGDSDFIKGIQYLIQNGMMKIPQTQASSSSNQIPSWIKNNAGWWANGTISNSDFVSGIQYLISEGIIIVNSQNSTNIDTSSCDKMQTAADKQTCMEQIQQENKLNNDMEYATPYVIGPVTFYNINNTIEYTEDGKTILTIHFVVKNTANSEITMSCQRQDSCNYSLYDGQKEIPYTTNTLVYGSLTILPNTPTYLDWTFYEGLDYSQAKNYSFIVKEPWGTGSIPLKTQ